MSKRTTPTTRAARIAVVLPVSMLTRLDGLIDRENGEDRSEAVRRLLAVGMRAAAR